VTFRLIVNGEPAEVAVPGMRRLLAGLAARPDVAGLPPGASAPALEATA